MFPVERALLLINRKAGIGQHESMAERLTSVFRRTLEDVEVLSVNDHATARAFAAEFVAASSAPALVVAGGGGGTLRAVIEGVCEARNTQNVCVGTLRMGSGNLLAKHFGVPADPVAALDGLLVNLRAQRTAPCCVIRCESRTVSGKSELHHGVTMGGLGQFGRIPTDLARWHARFPLLQKSAARLFGIERINDIEYGLALLIRSVRCVISPQRAELVEIEFGDQKQRFRLLSGVVMNFPFRNLPFEPDISVHDEAVVAYLVPLQGRFSPLWQVLSPKRLMPNTRSIRIEKNQRLDIRFVDRESIEFFLDEDPVTTYKRLSIEVAGSIAFVSGPDYKDK